MSLVTVYFIKVSGSNTSKRRSIFPENGIPHNNHSVRLSFTIEQDVDEHWVSPEDSQWQILWTPCDKVANNHPSITGGILERWHILIHLLRQQVILWRFHLKMDLGIRVVAGSSTYPPLHQIPHIAIAIL